MKEYDISKEFSYKGVRISRYDYESLPCPMAATVLDDEKMEKIARDTHDYLEGAGWSQSDIDKYISDPDEYEESDGENWDRDMIKSDFWRFMEKSAIENGMEYWEDNMV